MPYTPLDSQPDPRLPLRAPQAPLAKVEEATSRMWRYLESMDPSLKEVSAHMTLKEGTA